MSERAKKACDYKPPTAVWSGTSSEKCRLDIEKYQEPFGKYIPDARTKSEAFQ
jgi:hypothetical protein